MAALVPDLWLAVGVDPGASGGFAWLDCHGNYEAWDVDTKSLTDLRDLFGSVKAARDAGYAVVVALEDVHGRGGWGAKQTFSFGGAWWVPHSFLSDEGYDTLSIKPTQWQTEILGRGNPAPRDKDARKRLWVRAAERKFPEFCYTSGQADALWLANAAAVARGWLPGKD